MSPAVELAARLRRAIQTASNDDVSKVGTEEQRRHNERIIAMAAAVEFLETGTVVDGPRCWPQRDD